MTPYAAEAYRRITGVNPPRPFAEKTPDEQLHDWNVFLETVRNSNDADDDAVDDLFANIRMNVQLQAPDFTDSQKESA